MKWVQHRSHSKFRPIRFFQGWDLKDRRGRSSIVNYHTVSISLFAMHQPVRFPSFLVNYLNSQWESYYKFIINMTQWMAHPGWVTGVSSPKSRRINNFKNKSFLPIGQCWQSPMVRKTLLFQRTVTKSKSLLLKISSYFSKMQFIALKIQNSSIAFLKTLRLKCT